MPESGVFREALPNPFSFGKATFTGGLRSDRPDECLVLAECVALDLFPGTVHV